MSFKSLGLSDKLVQGILATGYTAPTAIQSQAIPTALQGRDIIGCAQTGTGKTAAFVLPILNRLAAHEAAGHASHGIKALVLTPTRELAQQVEESVKTYGRFMNLRTLAIYGGVGYGPQLQSLQRGVDFVVATPGRLIDLMNSRRIDLSKVEVLVLDEADRMMDMGFIPDVRRIVAQIPKERQTLMFSATMSREIRELTATIQRQPQLIEIGERRNPVATVTQHIFTVPREQKMDLLIHIVEEANLDCVLVFSRTKHGADRISQKLERRGIRSAALHSNRTQSQRQKALDGFKRGHYRVLVATDIAARGIDVEGISHVINFDTPVYAEDYIHRIGRTGRAMATGDAITFVSRDEEDHLRSIEKFIGKRLERKRHPTFMPTAPQPFHKPQQQQAHHPQPHAPKPAHHQPHPQHPPKHGPQALQQASHETRGPSPRPQQPAAHHPHPKPRPKLSFWQRRRQRGGNH
ncbi:MAG: DEAD/DEAH box helicase [Verrucomicrobia bacterium]|nr:DEAD/DEAH box helicase [Verrucomicrobiota bacterium]